MRTKISQKLKEKIVSEYLSSALSLRELEDKYGIIFQTIHKWVQEFEGKSSRSSPRPKGGSTKGIAKDLPKDIRQLQNELSRAKLYNKLLEELLDIGIEQYGIDLRKKTGAKQS